MTTVIKDDELKRVAEGVKPDAKKRVLLPGSLIREGVTYHIYVNSAGQILLDPQVMVPASEAWLFRDREALESVRRGIADAAEGRVSKIDPNDL
jgi:hypothetical protein